MADTKNINFDANADGQLNASNLSDTVPITTKGDILTYDTANQRLAVGTDGQVLSANSAEGTGLEWIDIPNQVPLTRVSVSSKYFADRSY